MKVSSKPDYDRIKRKRHSSSSVSSEEKTSDNDSDSDSDSSSTDDSSSTASDHSTQSHSAPTVKSEPPKNSLYPVLDRVNNDPDYGEDLHTVKDGKV